MASRPATSVSSSHPNTLASISDDARASPGASLCASLSVGEEGEQGDEYEEGDTRNERDDVDDDGGDDDDDDEGAQDGNHDERTSAEVEGGAPRAAPSEAEVEDAIGELRAFAGPEGAPEGLRTAFARPRTAALVLAALVAAAAYALAMPGVDAAAASGAVAGCVALTLCATEVACGGWARRGRAEAELFAELSPSEHGQGGHPHDGTGEPAEPAQVDEEGLRALAAAAVAHASELEAQVLRLNLRFMDGREQAAQAAAALPGSRLTHDGVAESATEEEIGWALSVRRVAAATAAMTEAVDAAGSTRWQKALWAVDRVSGLHDGEEAGGDDGASGGGGEDGGGGG
eukprot:3014381-Prymnesium_polylepis.1